MVEFTGFTKNFQVDPAVRLKIPIRALELTQIMGESCEFQVRAAARVAAVVLRNARSVTPRPHEPPLKALNTAFYVMVAVTPRTSIPLCQLRITFMVIS